MVAWLWNSYHHDDFLECWNMSPSAHLTSEQLKEVIDNKKKTDTGAMEVQEQVEDAEKVLDPDNSRSVFNTVLITIHNECERKSLDEEDRLPNANPMNQSIADRVPGNMHSIPGLPGMMVQVHQVWAIWLIVRRWVGSQICQEHWWQMKWVLARRLAQWQRQWYANCWLRWY